MTRIRISVPIQFLVLLILRVPLAATKQSSRIALVKVGSEKQIHILYSNGREFIAPKEKGQEDCDSPKVADDRSTAGWLVVQYPDCCVNYPIPLTLVIYHNGRVIQHFEPGQLIWGWQFLRGGHQVAFSIGPTHGAFTTHFELHDVQSGRLLAEWDGQVTKKRPAWVEGLKK